jgi:hypothetical protein
LTENYAFPQDYVMPKDDINKANPRIKAWLA